ncbi:hypothetical protein Dda_1110 [Drechslerella dactyloides]|uniref:Gem-associated protein 5 TPR domain-containing protein n=1 Tax=Drechslerella dactyloides TaxID=74499 RepID=A0AAD6NMP8_DREDA|nr:hypothetical protein Dda_1110 [Drechslerella dactyloides]
MASISPPVSYPSKTKSRGSNNAANDIEPDVMDKDKPLMSLAPCTSTASLFIFSQGSSITCVRHDTLQLERRFEAHNADITLIAADTSSENGDGQVISLDASKEAVVWDSVSGEEISRFTAYEEIRVATFLRNGTIALGRHNTSQLPTASKKCGRPLTFRDVAAGDNMGNIILFDPVRSEAVSCRTFQIPICALAPSADSKFFAIGYQNGTVIIATLMPTFVIHHTLASGSASAFPVTVLAWHGSSSRQKSDMLATQTNDGDLKVWSIAKPIDGGEAARVVRVLKKPDAYPSRRNWMSWSRNGRILQYSDYDTSIWDVRTKKVTWEGVMNKANILALTVYGPKGLMFAIDRQQNVQQYNLYPPQLMANVQHLPANAPPSPPNSVSHDQSRPGSNRAMDNERPESQRSVGMERSDSKASKFSQDAGARAIAAIKRDETRTPLGQIAHELEMLEEMEKSHLKSTGLSRSDSMQSNGTGHHKTGSVASSIKSYNSGTGMSDTTSLASPRAFEDLATPRRFHPLSQEIGMSPITPKAPANALQPVPYAQRNVNGDPLPTPGLPPTNGEFYDEQLHLVPPAGELELFPNLKDKLFTIIYKTPMKNGGPKYDDEKRREMFSSVFGFEGDAESLIREEIAQHPARSLQSLILRLWLHDLDANALNVLMGSETLVPSDWLFIALSAMGGQKSWQQTVRVFIMRLIQKGDVHNAVMCFLMIGERDQAIEHYVSNKKYMEAVLLTALFYKEWRRLAVLVKKWGEHAAENGEGGLAMRCFAITENNPDSVQMPAGAPAGGHSRKSSFSGSSLKSPASPQKASNVLQKPERPTSPRAGSSVRSTAARLFGFGDKDKDKNKITPEANIMDMPWNRPMDEQRNAPNKPVPDGLPKGPDDLAVQKEMIISGPINTTPVDGRIGTPALQRVASPGFAPPGRINSPAISINGALPLRSISPKPPLPPVPVDRTASPRPTLAAPNLVPQRIESPGPERMASPSPAPSMAVSHFGPSRVASPSQEGGLGAPQRTGSALSQRKPPGLHIQLSSFHDVLASEPSPELTRNNSKAPSHQVNRSVSKLNEVEVPSDKDRMPPPPARKASVSHSKPAPKTNSTGSSRRYDDSPEEDYDARSQSTAPRGRNVKPANNGRSQRRYESEKDQSYAEDSYDDEDSAQEEAERNLEARRRSLERLEQEMENVRLQRARSISRHGDPDTRMAGRRVKSPEQNNRGPARVKPKQPVHSYANSTTTEEEYTEDEDKRYPPRKTYNGYDTSEVSEVSEAEDRYHPPVSRVATRTPANRAPSRTQNRTPRVASRNGHRPPPARVPSRNQTRTPRYREETEDDEENYPPRRVQSRTQNRTPKPRAYEHERAMSPPVRGASRNMNKTPRPAPAPTRYDDFTEDDEEEAPRPRRKTPAPRQPVHEDLTESEADDFRPPPRQASRNQHRQPQRYVTETESEYEPIPRSMSRNGPSRTKTPSNANKPPSRATTPANGNAHRRKASVSDGNPPLPAAVAANLAKATSPVPDYDRHDYDLPALAAAAGKQAPGSILDNDRKPSHPSILRAKLGTLPAIPQSPMGLPADLPTHPAFAGAMRATTGLARKPAVPKQIDDIKTQTISIYGNGNALASPGKQALRMHSGPGGGDDMITVGLEGVVMDDGGAPVEAAPVPKAGRATPLGQRV